MTQIKKIQFYSNRVLTSGGQEFYPVTTSKAVYDGAKTIYDLLHNSYSQTNETFNNGVYAWLEHLEDITEDMIRHDEFNRYKSEIQQSLNSLSSIREDFENHQSNINNLIARHNAEIDEKIAKKLNKKDFDDLPTQSSTNLVTSGGVYSFVLKQLKDLSASRNISSSQPSTSSDVNIDEILCNNDYDSLDNANPQTTQPESPQPQGIDLSIYCTKVYAEQLFDQIEDKDTTYTAGQNIQISATNVISATDTKYTGDGITVKIDENNVISAIVGDIDMSNYYTRKNIDEKINETRNLIKQYEGDGKTVTISNGIISAVIPDTQLPDMSLYYTAKTIDTMLSNIRPVQYTADGKTITINDENVISAIIPESQLVDIATQSDNVHITSEVNNNVTTFTIDVDKPQQQTFVQEQADWNQTNKTKPDYIKNKPEIQSKIYGSKGDALYHDGNKVIAQPIMADGLVATTTEELNLCKNSAPSFEDVFNTWAKFSHLNDKDDAVASDINNWYYDSTKNTVVQPNNSTSYCGFVSPKSYSKYDITVRVYSNNFDDDTIGLVAAFAKDSNGKEHTLSFVRAARGTGATWVAILDLRAFSLTSTANGQAILIDKSAYAPTTQQNWSALGTGSVINITRNGNVFTAKCSQFNTSAIDDTTLITIDLDALSAQYPVLELFKGASPWGYSTFSQSNSMYENISIPNDNIIYDLVNNEVLLYDFNAKTWTIQQNATPIDAMGAGRFSYNDITNKLFYNDGSNVILVSKQSSISVEQSDWNESDSTSSAYIKNKPTLFSGNYADLSNKPTLFSGSYDDLTNKPTIPKMQVVADEATYNSMTKDSNTLYLIPAAV